MIFVSDVVNASRQFSIAIIEFHRTVGVDSSERDQPSFHFFKRNARVAVPFLVGLDARLGTVQQLFGPQAGHNDQPKA